MTIVTVDMDDTLIRTSHDYTDASEQFGDFVEHEYGIPAERAIEVQNEIDYELLETEGLKLERYPKSFVLALQELVDDPEEQHLEHARDIGHTTFKSADEYASRGFMDGARQMLDCLRSHTDNLHLVTVGDPKVQEPKIEALDLHQWFDEIHIPSYNQGKTAIFQDVLGRTKGLSENHFLHVGNSASSDVEAALNAGGHSVYISDDLDWLSDDDQHTEFVNHERVYPYECATEFVPDIPDVLKNHKPNDALSSRIV